MAGGHQGHGQPAEGRAEAGGETGLFNDSLDAHGRGEGSPGPQLTASFSEAK